MTTAHTHAHPDKQTQKYSFRNTLTHVRIHTNVRTYTDTHALTQTHTRAYTNMYVLTSGDDTITEHDYECDEEVKQYIVT